jgi:hypothetical protein
VSTTLGTTPNGLSSGITPEKKLERIGLMPGLKTSVGWGIVEPSTLKV